MHSLQDSDYLGAHLVRSPGMEQMIGQLDRGLWHSASVEALAKNATVRCHAVRVAASS